GSLSTSSPFVVSPRRRRNLKFKSLTLFIPRKTRRISRFLLWRNYGQRSRRLGSWWYSAIAKILKFEISYKVFQHGSAEQRKELANQLVGHILPSRVQMYGCPVIRKIESEGKTQEQFKHLLFAKIGGNIWYDLLFFFDNKVMVILSAEVGWGRWAAPILVIKGILQEVCRWGATISYHSRFEKEVKANNIITFLFFDWGNCKYWHEDFSNLSLRGFRSEVRNGYV
ncbi:hypothetical protein MKW98_015921, partial [Papaver atlanticum]